MPERETVGFIGLGLMGHGMARNILRKGYPLRAMAHRNRAPVEDLLAAGAEESATPRALAERCDVVLVCVSGTPQVEEVVYGADGLLEACRPGFVLVDCTTSHPAATRRIAADMARRGGAMADAPVTRAPADAEAGRLNSLVGADADTFARIRPILACYSETVEHFGPVGAGHAAKLCNNFVTLGYAALLAEAMAGAAALGVDRRKLCDVMSKGAADSGVLRKMIPPFLEGDLTGHKFALANALKDVAYGCDMLASIGFDSLLADGLRRTYAEAVERGFGESLMASLMEMHEQRCGWPVVPKA
jgi:3-hydroxyisobutyrate dehydrogenase-like beta-hydroxyacid dehydrogenase